MNIDIKLDNRINKLFKTNSRKVLSVYFTAGFPELDSALAIVEALNDADVDMIEIGIPFSDPVADGEVIQKSNSKALKNGMTLKVIFEQLPAIRRAWGEKPLILMGYLNPVFRFGFKDFCSNCERVGVDGLIIPDLPLIEIKGEYGRIMNEHGLCNVLLISPSTPDSRIREIDQLSSGFIYLVSSSATTGGSRGISDAQMDYFNKIRNMKLSNNSLIGFGISDKSSFESAGEYSDGAIIGSAFIKHLDRAGTDQKAIIEFIKSIRS